MNDPKYSPGRPVAGFTPYSPQYTVVNLEIGPLEPLAPFNELVTGKPFVVSPRKKTEIWVKQGRSFADRCRVTMRGLQARVSTVSVPWNKRVWPVEFAHVTVEHRELATVQRMTDDT